jgi:hypothetical protein
MEFIRDLLEIMYIYQIAELFKKAQSFPFYNNKIFHSYQEKFSLLVSERLDISSVRYISEFLNR